MKKTISVMVLLFLLFFCFSAMAEQQRVFDYANLFSSEEKAELESEILQFQKDTAIDFAILTTKEEITDQAQYADSFFDSGDFGYGKNNSGALYLIDMYNRVPYLSTAGLVIDIMTDDRIQYAHEICYNDLRNGKYFEAVQKMLVVLKSYIYDGVPFGQFRYQQKNRH